MIGRRPLGKLDASLRANYLHAIPIISAVYLVDQAMELAGGASFYRSSPLERAYRDVRAGKYHPLAPEQALAYAGRLGLGLPGDEV